MKQRINKKLGLFMSLICLLVSMFAVPAQAAEQVKVEEVGTESTKGSITLTIYDSTEREPGDGATPPANTEKPIKGVGFQYAKVGKVVQLTTAGKTQIAYGIYHAYLEVLSLSSATSIYTDESDVSYFSPEMVQKQLEESEQQKLEQINGTDIGKTDTDGKLVLQDLDLGLYLFTKTTLPAHAAEDISPFLVALPMYINGTWNHQVQVYPKLHVSEIIIEKTASTHDVQNESEVTYTIKAPISASTTAETHAFTRFQLMDAYDSCLKIATDSLEIQIGTTPLESGDYTIQNPNAEGGMTVALTATGLAKLNANLQSKKEVWFTYKATVDMASDVEVYEIPNKAKIVFQRGTEAVDTNIASVSLHTYGLNIKKLLSDNGTIIDDQIRFCLYSDEDGSQGSLLHFKKSDDTGHHYYLSKQGGSESLSVGGDGILNVNGLMPGTYWLEETRAMDGYTKLDKPIKIVIHGETADSEAAATVNDVAATMENGKVFLTIENTKVSTGFLLPQTGDAGTMLVTAIGSSLLCLTIILLVLYRKKIHHVEE